MWSDWWWLLGVSTQTIVRFTFNMLLLDGILFFMLLPFLLNICTNSKIKQWLLGHLQSFDKAFTSTQQVIVEQHQQILQQHLLLQAKMQNFFTFIQQQHNNWSQQVSPPCPGYTPICCNIFVYQNLSTFSACYLHPSNTRWPLASPNLIHESTAPMWYAHDHNDYAHDHDDSTSQYLGYW